MKRYFITGLVILLPLALTIAIVAFIFNLLTEPFAGIVNAILGHYGLLENGFLWLSAAQLQHFVSQVLILILLFFFTIGLGFVARWFFFHYLLRFWDYVLHRIPLISSIYKTSQDVIKTMFTSKNQSFKQVVMVRFPNSDTYSIGLVTRDNLPGLTQDSGNLTAVFVPTTPNPTSGFLMMYKETDLIYLDMRVEDAFKYIISCGVIPAPFHTTTKEEIEKRMLESNKPLPSHSRTDERSL